MSRILHLLKLRFPVWAFSWFVLGADIIAGWIAYYVIIFPHYTNGINPFLIFILIQLLWSLVFVIGNLYKGEFTISRIHETKTFLQITFTGVVFVIFLEAIRIVSLSISPRGLLKYWMLFSAIAILGRLFIRGYQKYLLGQGIGRERTLIIGNNKRGQRAAIILDQHHQQGFDVVGFIQADDEPVFENTTKFQVLGNEENIHQIISEYGVSDVVLALTHPEHTRIMNTVSRINGAPVTIKVLPDLYEVISGLARTQQIAGLPLMELDLNLHTIYVSSIKRLVDILIGIPMLIAAIPVWALVAILVKIDSKGPILYRQERLGFHGKPFNICKFRSMRQDAEQGTGPVWAGENDNRITSVGRWLRRFRLDEIPQLMNVVRGDMSLIGPRPERPYFVDKLMKEFPFYHRRLNVKPGISGWAQIKHPYDQDIEDVRQKLKYDFYYIENISFSLDIKILFSTAWVVFSGQGR